MVGMNFDLNKEDKFINSPATSRFSGIFREKEPTVQVRGLDGDDIASIDALPSDSALLIARRGPNVGARFLLNSAETTAGRHPKSDIFLDDVTVSRRHATFLRTEAGFSVRDNGSLNGTYVNQNIVEESPLVSGDEVRIGKYQFTFFESPRAVQ